MRPLDPSLVGELREAVGLKGTPRGTGGERRGDYRFPSRRWPWSFVGI
jgi:hypothetical protein